MLTYKHITLLLLFTTGLTLAPSLTFAGTLDNLEESATQSSSSKSSNKSKSSSSSGNHEHGELSDSAVELMFDITFKVIEGLAWGGGNSMQRYENSQANELSLYREKGDPILPTLRLSTQWLNASNGISAQQTRLEAGFGLIGISHSVNNLKEPGDSLTLKNTLMHYRMSLSNDFSWDLAFGSGQMQGNKTHSGNVFAMPMRMRLTPKLHFEYYPVWSKYGGNTLFEHQFSLNWQYQHVGLTTGYKSWSAGPTNIKGVFAGLYLNF